MTTSRVDDCVGEDGVGRGTMGPRGLGVGNAEVAKTAQVGSTGMRVMAWGHGVVSYGRRTRSAKGSMGLHGGGEGSTGGRELNIEEDDWEKDARLVWLGFRGDGEGFTASAGTINRSTGHHAMSVGG